MPHDDNPAQQPKKSTRDPLSAKAWTAITAAGLFFCTIAWVVASVLTATPSLDPTVHTRALELAARDQPDPDQPSRYADLLEALADLDRQIAAIANEVVSEEEIRRTGVAEINFFTIVEEPDPTADDAEQIARYTAEARRAVNIILQRGLFDDFFEILQSPNLANEYASAFDPSGNLLPMYEWLLMELSDFRRYSMAIVASARVLAERGETEQAAALLEGISPLPGVLTRHVTLVEHLVGYAVGALIASEIEYLAAHPDLTPEALASLRRAQERIADIGSLETAIDGEAIFTRDFHYRTHTAGGRYIPSAGDAMMGSSSSSPSGDFAAKLTDAAGYLAVRRDTSLAKANEFYDMMRDAINETDPAKRTAILNDFDREIESLGPRYALIQMVMPAIGRVVTNTSRYHTQSRATAILLAMAEYRLDSGDWPTSVDELVPDHLDAVPINPLTGDPFEYDHEPGEPPTLERLGARF
jgi:hypothetical protein